MMIFQTIAKENENKATHLDTELRRLRTEGTGFFFFIPSLMDFLGSELQRKLDELKAQNNEAIRLEQEIISQGKQNDEIIGEMADLKQAILSLSRTGTEFFIESRKPFFSSRKSTRTERKQHITRINAGRKRNTQTRTIRARCQFEKPRTQFT